jgi:hypothetical protein
MPYSLDAAVEMHRELTPVTEHEHHCKFLAILFLIAAVHLLRSRGLSFTARPVAPHDASIGTCIYRGSCCTHRNACIAVDSEA